MKRWFCQLTFAALIAVVVPRDAFAGMASPLPSDPKILLRLNETAGMRLQAISFFLVVLLGCTLVFRFLWNFRW